MTGRIRGDADDIIFLKFDPLLPLSNSQVPDHNPMALLLRITPQHREARGGKRTLSLQVPEGAGLIKRMFHRKTSPGITWRSKFQITNSNPK